MTPDEADRIIAEKGMGWVERDGTRGLDGGKLWWPNDPEADDFICYQSDYHPSRDRNQLYEVLGRLSFKQRAMLVHKLEDVPSCPRYPSWQAEWWFFTAPTAVCAVAMAEVLKEGL